MKILENLQNIVLLELLTTQEDRFHQVIRHIKCCHHDLNTSPSRHDERKERDFKESKKKKKKEEEDEAELIVHHVILTAENDLSPC